MAYSDRELLARIVQCEAGGEGDNGMKAVATSILNRVNATDGEYARAVTLFCPFLSVQAAVSLYHFI